MKKQVEKEKGEKRRLWGHGILKAEAWWAFLSPAPTHLSENKHNQRTSRGGRSQSLRPGEGSTQEL